jgi:hypothetical protein
MDDDIYDLDILDAQFIIRRAAREITELIFYGLSVIKAASTRRRPRLIKKFQAKATLRSDHWATYSLPISVTQHALTPYPLAIITSALTHLFATSSPDNVDYMGILDLIQADVENALVSAATSPREAILLATVLSNEPSETSPGLTGMDMISMMGVIRAGQLLAEFRELDPLFQVVYPGIVHHYNIGPGLGVVKEHVWRPGHSVEDELRRTLSALTH